MREDGEENPYAGGSKGPTAYIGFPKVEDTQSSSAERDTLSYASQVLINTPSHCMNMLLERRPTFRQLVQREKITDACPALTMGAMGTFQGSCREFQQPRISSKITTYVLREKFVVVHGRQAGDMYDRSVGKFKYLFAMLNCGGLYGRFRT